MVRIGFVSMAHMHAFSYAAVLQSMSSATLTGIYDPDSERGQQAAEQFQTEYHAELEPLLERCDAVIICSENSLHKQYTLAAAEVGCHVLCEKPIATTEEDALEMIHACDTAGVKLEIAFPCRFATPVQQAKQLLDQGILGEILCIKGTNHGQMPGGWFTDRSLSGGGAVMDHTVHVVDLIRWFFGREIKTMYAEVDTMLYDVDIDDCGMLSMEFEGGMFATQDPSWSRPRTFPAWGDVLLEIIGTKGTMQIDAFAQALTVYDDSEKHVSHHSWADNMDALLVEHFLSVVREDKDPMITGYDGLQALRAALAAYRSSEEGAPVPVRR